MNAKQQETNKISIKIKTILQPYIVFLEVNSKNKNSSIQLLLGIQINQKVMICYNLCLFFAWLQDNWWKNRSVSLLQLVWMSDENIFIKLCNYLALWFTCSTVLHIARKSISNKPHIKGLYTLLYRINWLGNCFWIAF